jgi:hypothetical protein
VNLRLVSWSLVGGCANPHRKIPTCYKYHVKWVDLAYDRIQRRMLWWRLWITGSIPIWNVFIRWASTNCSDKIMYGGISSLFHTEESVHCACPYFVCIFNLSLLRRYIGYVSLSVCLSVCLLRRHDISGASGADDNTMFIITKVLCVRKHAVIFSLIPRGFFTTKDGFIQQSYTVHNVSSLPRFNQLK